ncbi:cupin domain-containing protein [Lacrimispora sp. NSJ-141]|uniref:Cupin domain-containing protein n=1 Tax=Lientehia hominis TaxID=2897778 RepID=A0AAP2RK80_9FIRM|nr:cupin domain-containing protein [Lientehia hominis]MCD2493739.1 cupin domain-containing protein [Lientehia hominis]
MEKRGKIVRKKEAKISFEGEELCRSYFKTEKIIFGLSVLKPGVTGGLDAGHEEADEVFFCTKGNVACYFPEDGNFYELDEYDGLLIPPGTGHRLYNLGEEEAVVIWACAPHQ